MIETKLLPTKSTLRNSFLALAAALALPLVASAGTHVWTGGSLFNENWSSAQNWSGGAPSANEAPPVVLEFPAAFTGPFTNNIANLKVDGLRLLGSGQVIRGADGVSLTVRAGNTGTNIHSAGVNHLDASLPLILEGQVRITAPLSLSLNSAISGVGGLTIHGGVRFDGTLPNSYVGATIVQSGVLTLDKESLIIGGVIGKVSVPGSLFIEGGMVMSSADDNIADNALVTVEAGASLNLNNHDDTIGGLHLTAAGVESGAGILTLSGNVVASGGGSVIGGRLSLGGASRVFDIASGATVDVEAVINNGSAISNPGITKSGNGTLRLSAANTFSGSVNVTDGAVEVAHSLGLGSTFFSGTAVSVDATLDLQDGIIVHAESLTLNGGKLRTRGIAAWTGPVLLNGDVLFQASFGGNDLQLTGPVSGSGGFTHIGQGKVTLAGTNGNTFAGTVNINEGDLFLAKSDGRLAVPGNLIVGFPSNTNNENVVWLQEREQIADTATVTLLSSALLAMNNVEETIGGLVLDGGEVATGPGTLILDGDVAVQPSSDTARIAGKLNLGDAMRIFDVAASAQAPALDVSAVVSGTALGGWTKTGGGTILFSGSNTYSGLTTVAKGELIIDHPLALGAANVPTYSGTIVQRGATLNVLSPGSGIMERLTLTGLGPATNGALVAQANITWGGVVVIAGDAMINVTTFHTLTLTNQVTGEDDLVKTGNGTLVLGGALDNTYDGDTYVFNGKLALNKAANRRAVPGILRVGTGGSNPVIVQALSAGQLNHAESTVFMGSDAVLDFTDRDQRIHQLYGYGEVKLGNGLLRLYGGNFHGKINGIGGSLRVESSLGGIRLWGTNTYTGPTWVENASLWIEGAVSGPVRVLNNGRFGGSGTAGDVDLSASTLTPGYGFFGTGHPKLSSLALTNGSTFYFETRAVDGGIDYDQADVTGAVKLNNATLDIHLGVPGMSNIAYILIRNAGSDAVQGTFNNLPEGATFSHGGAQLQITYAGGDGNDVVLKQLTPSTNNYDVKLTVTPIPNNKIRVGWPAFAVDYELQSCTNLMSGSWQPAYHSIYNDGTNKWADITSTNLPPRAFRLMKDAF
ncbi:MAG TPA: autotransporter-associated beta strand repeat-containing protein [Verrucomicrobiae bacterium]|nr:autotransporter-associated beta strand repeat-containing protein [Verrucomicrobiae bacterium]